GAWSTTAVLQSVTPRDGRAASGRAEASAGSRRGVNPRAEPLRVQLLERRERLHAAVQRGIDSLAEEEGRFRVPGLDELPSDVDGEELTVRVLDRESRALEQVEWALQRLDQGCYGQCELCAEPIGVARLEALPLATTCIECEREREREAALDA